MWGRDIYLFNSVHFLQPRPPTSISYPGSIQSNNPSRQAQLTISIAYQTYPIDVPFLLLLVAAYLLVLCAWWPRDSWIFASFLRRIVTHEGSKHSIHALITLLRLLALEPSQNTRHRVLGLLVSSWIFPQKTQPKLEFFYSFMTNAVEIYYSRWAR